MKKVKLLKLVLTCLSCMMFCMATAKNVCKTPASNYPDLATQNINNEPYKIYKDWYMLIETSEHIEISARVIQCEKDGPKQVQFLFFNENPVAKNQTFTVKIVNDDDGRSFTIQKTVQAALAEMMIPDCAAGNNKLDNLKLNIPAGYNPEKLTISITL